MVHQIPDPTKPEVESLDVEAKEENLIAGVVQSDSDDGADEENEYSGYMMLPAESSHQNDEQEIDSEEENESIHESQPNIPDNSTCNFDEGTRSEVSAVWNTPRLNDQPMDSEQAAKVLKAMEGFTLPLSATPTWATGISEEEFQKFLKEKIAPK